MIPSEVIEDIRNQVNILDIVSEVIQLKRAGSNFMGLCPFHNEKSPSFSISSEKQLYYCFGCGEGGTAYNFLMKYYGLSFPEALERLARSAGVDLEPYRTADSAQFAKRKEAKKKYQEALNYSAECFHKSLLKSPRAQVARDYVKNRKLTLDTLQKWQMGYAPAGGSQLLDVLLKQNFEKETILTSGLAREGRGQIYDYFRNRLMFPIMDVDGQVIAFGGRALSKEDQPKYINSPETPVFDKSSTLFGLFQAVSSFRQQKTALLAEGYTDVIALHEHGFTNAVATLGTSFTIKHAKKLKKYVGKVTLVYDGDKAGKKAALRAMEPILVEGLSCNLIILPNEMDPDEYLSQEGTQAFAKLVETAPGILDYFVEEHYFKEKELGKKAEFIGFLANIIGQMKDVFAKEALVGEVCRMTGVEKSSLIGSQKRSIESFEKQQVSKPLKVTGKSEALDTLSTEELILFRLMFEHSNVRSVFQRVPTKIFSKLFLSRVEHINKDDSEFDRDKFIHELSEELGDHQFKSEMTRVFMDDSLDLKSDWQKIFSDCLDKISKRYVRNLSRNLMVLENENDEARINEIFSEIRELKSVNWNTFIQ